MLFPAGFHLIVDYLKSSRGPCLTGPEGLGDKLAVTAEGYSVNGLRNKLLTNTPVAFAFGLGLDDRRAEILDNYPNQYAWLVIMR